jgi:transcriptional antiterminator/mannitol/fructose-specific phosphotransferase system IIA component (Ntr-type)
LAYPAFNNTDKLQGEGDHVIAKANLSPKDRKYEIISRLLNGEHLSYQQLSDEYFVSRSSIAGDISTAKQILAQENAPLAFDNSGTYIKGGEVLRQRVTKRIVLDLMLAPIPNTIALTMFLDMTLLKQLRQAFEKKLQKWHLEVPESYLQDILVTTAIVITRGRAGRHIEVDERNQFGDLFFQFEKYPLVYDLLMSVESDGMYHFSQAELRYLSYVILGNGFKFFMKNATIPGLFKQKVKKLITSVSTGIDIDLNQDSRLESDLLVHLYQLVLRLRANTTVVNPLLSEIRKNYRKLFGVVWYALNDFGHDNHLTISADEVGFVTIHFQAAIERTKKMRRILFVCPNGIGTSSLISAKIRRIFPDIPLIEAVSVANLARMDLADVDLILTTVSIGKVSQPVVNISPLLTTEDMKNVMSKYIDITTAPDRHQNKTDAGNLLKTLTGLSGHVFFDNLKTRETALNFLIHKNTWDSEAHQQAFKESVQQRETIQSTYMSNGFVIPHGDPALVDHTNISILVLDKPIPWGNYKADVIALLMIRKKDTAAVEPFMDLLMKGIEDKNWFISKMMEVK